MPFKKKVSKNMSMKGWDFLTYLKGSKKLVIALVGYILGYWITNEHTASVISAAVVERLYAITEYYIKRIEY